MFHVKVVDLKEIYVLLSMSLLYDESFLRKTMSDLRFSCYIWSTL